MSYEVKMIEDSISPDGIRLTTMQLTYPRFIHAEFMTHRVFSRNASSSRAIPVARLSATQGMVYPIRWGKNQAGMQASMEDLSIADQKAAQDIWDNAANVCRESANALAHLGLHKQWSNRMLEWFGTITVVVTATEWDNFFALRDHPDAQPEIQHLAILKRAAMDSSSPKLLQADEWHLPYVLAEERASLDVSIQLKCSGARCARTSYLNHDGTAPNVEKDVDLYHNLVVAQPAHASPVEHQATPADKDCWYGNFRGWRQHRKVLGL